MAVPAALVAIMVHEVCHGFTAYLLGDPTARERKRLSFNPIRHIDPVGLLLLIVAGFGWAKPVPVDSRYFKRPKAGMALVALAGPLSNFALAFVSVALIRVTLMFSGLAAEILFNFFTYMALRSAGLGIFNLFPIPPLDGSKILGAALPDRAYYTLMRVERYGFILLMGLLWLGLLDVPLTFLLSGVMDAFYGVFGVVIPSSLQLMMQEWYGPDVRLWQFQPGENLFEFIKSVLRGGV